MPGLTWISSFAVERSQITKSSLPELLLSFSSAGGGLKDDWNKKGETTSNTRMTGTRRGDYNQHKDDWSKKGRLQAM